MNLGEATAIFRNIYNSEGTGEEKKLAIRTVLDMDTHNGITKQEFINALDWLINHPDAYDVEKVVERLEECKQIMLSPVSQDCYNEECKVGDCIVCAFEKAIEIVKKGGANED